MINYKVIYLLGSGSVESDIFSAERLYVTQGCVSFYSQGQLVRLYSLENIISVVVLS